MYLRGENVTLFGVVLSGHSSLFRHHESELQLVHGGQWVQGAVIAITTDT